jgi:hypothetical protein
VSGFCHRHLEGLISVRILGTQPASSSYMQWACETCHTWGFCVVKGQNSGRVAFTCVVFSMSKLLCSWHAWISHSIRSMGFQASDRQWLGRVLQALNRLTERELLRAGLGSGCLLGVRCWLWLCDTCLPALDMTAQPVMGLPVNYRAAKASPTVTLWQLMIYTISTRASRHLGTWLLYHTAHETTTSMLCGMLEHQLVCVSQQVLSTRLGAEVVASSSNPCWLSTCLAVNPWPLPSDDRKLQYAQLCRQLSMANEFYLQYWRSMLACVTVKYTCIFLFRSNCGAPVT